MERWPMVPGIQDVLVEAEADIESGEVVDSAAIRKMFDNRSVRNRV
jgi:hypothetical protein